MNHPEEGSTEQSHSDVGSHHSPTASLMTSVIRMAASAARAAGYERTSKLITDWPELAGTKIGQLILRMRHQEKTGKAVTPSQQAEVESAMAQEPQAAAQILGLVIGEASDHNLSADEEKNQILICYGLVLDTVTRAMTTAKTSYALSGFLHDPDCISYWHHNGLSPKFSRFGDYLFTSSMEVYFLSASPTPENLQLLNEEIRRNPERHLSQDLYDFKSNRDISLLGKVEELTVTVKHLKLEEAPPNPFGLSGISSTVETTFYIPFGAPPMLTMFESLLDAQRVQSSALSSLKATERQVKLLKGKLK